MLRIVINIFIAAAVLLGLFFVGEFVINNTTCWKDGKIYHCHFDNPHRLP